MNLINIIELAFGILIPITIAGVIGWVKINRQVETLETKLEGFEKDLNRGKTWSIARSKRCLLKLEQT